MTTKTMNSKFKTFKQLPAAKREMVRVLLIGLTTGSESNPIEYSERDVSDHFKVSHQSLAAFRANLNR